MIYKYGGYTVLLCITLLLTGCSARAEGSAATAVTSSSAGEAAVSGDTGLSVIPAVTDYLTYSLLKGLSDADVSAPGDTSDSMGLRHLFVYNKAKTEDAPSAPREWLAAGGVMFYDKSLISYENGVISSVQLLWNHSGFLTAPERVPDGEADVVIIEAEHDLYTAAQIGWAEDAGHPIPEDQRTARMWYAIFARQDGHKAYAVFLNEKYFGKDDMIKLVQSVHFKAGAFLIS